jgi:hypothetical protein
MYFDEMVVEASQVKAIQFVVKGVNDEWFTSYFEDEGMNTGEFHEMDLYVHGSSKFYTIYKEIHQALEDYSNFDCRENLEEYFITITISLPNISTALVADAVKDYIEKIVLNKTNLQLNIERIKYFEHVEFGDLPYEEIIHESIDLLQFLDG